MQPAVPCSVRQLKYFGLGGGYVYIYSTYNYREQRGVISGPSAAKDRDKATAHM